MNIGIFTDTYLPDINGVVSSCVTLKGALEQLGHTVYVITNHSGSKICREGNVLRLPGIELKRLYGYKVSSPIQLNADKYVKELDLDVIHIQTEYGIALYGRHVAKEFHLPLVYTYHTMWEDYTHYFNPLDFSGMEKVTRKTLRSISKTYGNGGQAVIAPSAKTRDALLEYGVHAPIYIVPTGLDLSRFEPDYINPEKEAQIRKELGLNDSQHIVLFVGRLAKEKMLEMVIEAVKQSPDADMRLVIVGSGTDADYFRQCAGNDSRIIFTGKVPGTEVPYYYSLADCFASASTSETQGMTYIEALAAGLPVFGRRDPVLEDLVDEGVTGHYFDSADELKTKLERFFESEHMSSQVCRSKAAPYTTSIFGSKVAAVYSQAIEDYKHTYIVEKLQIQNNFIMLTLQRDSDVEPLRILIPMDDFFDLKIGVSTRLDVWLVNSYLEMQSYYKVLMAATNRLANRDMTARQLKEWAVFHQQLDANQADTLVEELTDKGLIDDEKYASEKMSYWHDMGYSRLAIVRKLAKAGIDKELIDSVIGDLDEDLEYANAKALAARLVRTIKGASAKGKRQSVVRKLVTRGYSTEIARKASESLEIDADSDEDALELALSKAMRLYSSLDDKKRESKIMQYCLRKGFGREQIEDALEKEEMIYDQRDE